MTDLVASQRDSLAQTAHVLGLDTRRPEVVAMLTLAARYGLDPLMREITLIPQPGGAMQPYIGRDGWIRVAHASGQLDGIEVVAETSDREGWTATVSVWRKDMGRPFTFTGTYGRNEKNARAGRQMALKRAEAAALKRAFPLGGVATDGDEQPAPAPAAPAPDGPLGEKARQALIVRLAERGIRARQDRLDWATGVLDREVETFTSLTRVEGRALWDATDMLPVESGAEQVGEAAR